MGARRIDLAAAGVAFYGIFALFPALAALVSVFGYFADPEIIETAFRDYSELLPPEAVDLIGAQLQGLMQTHESTLGWTSLLSLEIALWSARLGVGGLSRGLTAVYGLPARGGLMFYLHGLALTVAMVSVGVTAMILLVVLPIVLAFVPLGGFYAVIAEILRWMVALAVVVVGLALFYRYGPNRDGAAEPGMVLWPGIVVAVALLLGASVGLNWYLAHFADYNRLYGSIGAVIIMLLWFYVAAYAVLLGGVTNAVLEGRANKG